MKILVIPDLHQAHNLDQIDDAIHREQPALTLCLGDYFDQWFDSANDAERTARWLKKSLALPNRVHLWGNHDLSYAFPHNNLTYCSGFTDDKLEKIQGVLTSADWKQLKLVHWEGPFLFSHAGWSRQFAPEWLGDTSMPTDALRRYLTAQEAEAWSHLHAGRSHWIFGAGRSRGGIHPAGGLIWCDYSELLPIPGLHQIFGHTPGSMGALKRAPESINVCLDTTERTAGLRHYLVLHLCSSRTLIRIKTIAGSVEREIRN